MGNEHNFMTKIVCYHFCSFLSPRLLAIMTRVLSQEERNNKSY